MSKQNFLFVQKVLLAGKELDKSMIQSTSYIEHANMNGSIVMMDISDENGSFRDEHRIRQNTTLELTLGDPDGSGVLFTERFTVIKAPTSSGQMRIYAVQADMKTLKTPTTTPKFFTQRQPAQIIQMLAKGIPLQIGRVNGLCTYHLDMGETPSALLREVATDHASLCYWSRGKLCLVPYSEAFAQAPILTLEAHNPKAEHTIGTYRWIDDEHASAEKNTKRYVSYSMTEGILAGAGAPDAPVEFVPMATPTQLMNRMKHIRPALEIETAGYGALQAGMMVGIRINKMNAENVLDESVPPVMIILNITHHETQKNYTCKLQLGVLCG
ncbi:hypothetical protein [Edwardsiella tarda]|uniref:hypothetical protein n=1 Tax=Edwardsiella tarda TaxID=636 RepID=UPI00351C6DC1